MYGSYAFSFDVMTQILVLINYLFVQEQGPSNDRVRLQQMVLQVLDRGIEANAGEGAESV